MTDKRNNIYTTSKGSGFYLSLATAEKNQYYDKKKS